jgi:hypothetical protein
MEPPSAKVLEDVFARLRRHRLIRTAKPDGMMQLGELQIEILPSLTRVIPFDSVEEWQSRVEAFQPTANPSAEEGAALEP